MLISTKSLPFRGLALAALAALAGCSTEPPEQVNPADRLRGLTLDQRFIAADVTEILDTKTLSESQTIRRWSAAQVLTGWDGGGDGHREELPVRLRMAGGELELEWAEVPSDQPPLRFDLELDPPLRAAEASSVEVDLLNLQGIRLRWVRGNGACETCRVTVMRGTSDAVHSARYHVPLATRAEWAGTIVGLTLEVPPDPLGLQVLKEVRLLRARPVPERVTAALGRPWKVNLGNDYRNALLTSPSRGVDRSVFVAAPGARLRFAYGLQAGAPRTTFIVAASVDGARQELWRRTVGPRGSGASGEKGGTGEEAAVDRWHLAEVPLKDYARETVEVSLEVEAAEESGVAAFACWAHPEILIPRAALATALDRPNSDSAGMESPDAIRPGLERPNIVLISIDTLRADRMSTYGHDRSTTPNIDEWAKGGTVFERAIAPAPWTLPSHVSMMTGLDAVRHGANSTQEAPASLRMLAEIFRGHGYQTAAITGGGFVHPVWGMAQGFDTYRSYSELNNEAELETGVRQAVQWLGRAPSPFFLFFHTYEVHSPFRARGPFYDEWSSIPRGHQLRLGGPALRAEKGFLYHRSLSARLPDGTLVEPIPPELVDLPLDLYDSGVAHMDALVGRLLKRLAELEQPTFVVLTSDHGELFGEHGEFSHYSLFDKNLHVPLIVAGPGVAAGRVESLVGLEDIAPTLLELAGFEASGGATEDMDGQSLVAFLAGDGPEPQLPTIWSYASSSNFGLAMQVGDRLKYTFQNSVWPSEDPKEAVYALDRDPSESQNLVSEHRDLEQIRGRVRTYLDQQIRGPRLHLWNRGTSILRGSFRGGLADPKALKTLAPVGDRFSLSGDRGEFSLEPGGTLDLYVEGHAAPTTFVLRQGMRETTYELDLRDLDAAHVAVLLVAGHWSERHLEESANLSAVVNDAPVGLLVSFRSDAVTEAKTADDELRRQLSALGYVD